jgi:hypothetical protein
MMFGPYYNVQVECACGKRSSSERSSLKEALEDLEYEKWHDIDVRNPKATVYYAGRATYTCSATCNKCYRNMLKELRG